MDHILAVVQQHLYLVRMSLLVGQADLPRSIGGTILADENVKWVGTALFQNAVQAGPDVRRMLIRGDDDRDPSARSIGGMLHATIPDGLTTSPLGKVLLRTPGPESRHHDGAV